MGKQKGTNVNVQRINEIMLQNRIIYCKTHIFIGDTRFISTRIDQCAGDRFDTLCEKLDILSKKRILSWLIEIGLKELGINEMNMK